MQRRFFADYLNFTQKERLGIFTVLGLIVTCLALPFFFAWFKTDVKVDSDGFEEEIAALKITQQTQAGSYTSYRDDDGSYQSYSQPSDKKYYQPQRPAELFYFDPNTLSADGWVKLGVSEKTANTIKKYTAKGGKFYKPEDLGKIWGLHPDEVSRLLPFVRIESATPQPLYTSFQNSKPAVPSVKNTLTIIDINATDTSALIALPGIGSKLANRIISFRDKLGGFYSVDQVAETYALPDSTFQKIKSRLGIQLADIKKININKATIDELKEHPYIRYNIAKVIIEYRNMHGDFTSIDDLKKIMIITDEVFDKASPYLTIK